MCKSSQYINYGEHATQTYIQGWAARSVTFFHKSQSTTGLYSLCTSSRIGMNILSRAARDSRHTPSTVMLPSTNSGRSTAECVDPIHHMAETVATASGYFDRASDQEAARSPRHSLGEGKACLSVWDTVTGCPTHSSTGPVPVVVVRALLSREELSCGGSVHVW